MGTDPTADGTKDAPMYGWIRFPAHLADGDPTNKAPGDSFTRMWVYYRWRNNGFMPAAGTWAWIELPDLVCAYYRTGAVLDVGLTVARADPSAKGNDRIVQTAHLTRRVNLQSVTRNVPEIK